MVSYSDLMVFYNELMVFYSDLMVFYNDLMVSYGDLMVSYSDLMVFYNDLNLMGYFMIDGILMIYEWWRDMDMTSGGFQPKSWGTPIAGWLNHDGSMSSPHVVIPH